MSEYVTLIAKLRRRGRVMDADVADLIETQAARIAKLEALINNPHTGNFLEAVRLEAAHQRDRWGDSHDLSKTDADWFWVLGYLAGKALHKPDKSLHHIITTAAACLNWHAQKTGVTPGRLNG